MILKLVIGFITIVKFSKRKVCQQVLRVKKELKNIDPSGFDFPEGTPMSMKVCVPITKYYGTNARSSGKRN